MRPLFFAALCLWPLYTTLAVSPFEQNLPPTINPQIFQALLENQEFRATLENFQYHLIELKDALPQGFLCSHLSDLKDDERWITEGKIQQTCELKTRWTDVFRRIHPECYQHFITTAKNQIRLFERDWPVVQSREDLTLTRQPSKPRPFGYAYFFSLQAADSYLDHYDAHAKLAYRKQLDSITWHNLLELDYFLCELEKHHLLTFHLNTPRHPQHERLLKAVCAANAHTADLKNDEQKKELWMQQFFCLAQKSEQDTCLCLEPFEYGDIVVNFCIRCKPSLFHKACFDTYREKCSKLFYGQWVELTCPYCCRDLCEKPLIFKMGT